MNWEDITYEWLDTLIRRPAVDNVGDLVCVANVTAKNITGLYESECDDYSRLYKARPHW